MGLKILCSGHLIRYPLGGFSWHHLQYLLGWHRLGHQVVYFEHYGWNDSCYNPVRHEMTDDPGYGLSYFADLLKTHDADIAWSYMGNDERTYGMPRDDLTQFCRECDVYFNLSNINWIPELTECRRRVLVDTDPVFTQIKAHGLGGPFEDYAVRFTYGENVGRPRCTMPDGASHWLPTRQPVVLDCWTPTRPPDDSALTTVMNWSAYGDHTYQGRTFGQKSREFTPYFTLPRDVDASLSIAINAPEEVKQQLTESGWGIVDPLKATLTPTDYQSFITASLAEFSVAKHGYVVTNSGWFSDRSCGYMASGRPVILQDTGFSEFLPTGEGLMAFRGYDEAKAAVNAVAQEPEKHSRTARRIIEEYFEAGKVLGDMLAKVM